MHVRVTDVACISRVHISEASTCSDPMQYLNRRRRRRGITDHVRGRLLRPDKTGEISAATTAAILHWRYISYVQTCIGYNLS